MRILVVGKGAVGGYFGGRLQEAGADVTFLVRRKTDQLSVKSVHGDMELRINSIVSGETVEPFDLVLLSTKAYHLEQAIEDVKPFVNENTFILPLLNGVHHISALAQAFPQTLGAVCFIESTVNLEGQVIQTSQRHDIVFGDWNGKNTDRQKTIYELFSRAHFKTVLSDDIQTAMWNKYVFITGLSGITTLMNSAIGPILESPYGSQLFHQLFEEINLIAQAEGFNVFSPEKNIKIAAAMGAGMKASMLRDMEKGLPIEVDHLQGRLIELGSKHAISTPLLKVIYNRLKVYELNR